MQINVLTTGISRDALAGLPEWQRWRDETGKWTREAARRAITSATAADGPEWVELRYRNLVPDPEQWDAIVNDRPAPTPATGLRSSPTFTRTTPT